MKIQSEIDLVQIFAACLRRGKAAIISAFIVGILFGAFQYKSQLNIQQENARVVLGLEEIDDLHQLENWEEKIKEANEKFYQTELKNYKESQMNLNSQRSSTQDKMEQQRKYIIESLLMRLDPYQVYTTHMYFSVSCTDESAYNQQFAVTITPDDYIYGKIIDNYSMVWNGTDLGASLNLPGYENVADRYFRELLSLSSSGNNTLVITSKAGSAEESEALCRAAYNFLNSKVDVISDNSYQHTVTPLSTVTTNDMDQDILAAQESAYAVLETYKDTVTELDKQLENLHSPSRSMNELWKNIIIYAVIGMVVGVLLVYIIIILKCIIGSVESAGQIEKILHLVSLGRMPYHRGIFDKISDFVSGEHIWADKATALAYISEKSILQCGGCKNIALLSTLPLTGDQVADVQNALEKNSAHVTFCNDYFHNPNAMNALLNCDSIVLIEVARKSKMERISAIITYAQQLDKSVDGFVLM